MPCTSQAPCSRDFFLKNPVLLTLPFSRTTIKCGPYPVIINYKSLMASFHITEMPTSMVWPVFVQNHMLNTAVRPAPNVGTLFVRRPSFNFVYVFNKYFSRRLSQLRENALILINVFMVYVWIYTVILIPISPFSLMLKRRPFHCRVS